jgi:steroid 5-alpha reductase family enzyme
MGNLMAAMAVAGLILVVAMTLAWVLQRVTSNCGWVDATWSYATAAAGMTAALWPGVPRGGRAALAALLIGAWGLRLGTHIARRSASGHEDVRYAELRRQWGAAFQGRLFVFLMIQAVAALVLVLSVLMAARAPFPFPRAGDAAGLLILLAAIAGEGIADAQLQRFRVDPRNRGQVCETGLWRYSRHPNYFFEWLGWCAWPVLAIAPLHPLAYPLGWLALIGPAFMYWLLVHVSGIPPLEERMLASRGETYRAYQARTRAFLPLPRLRHAGSGA